MPTANINVRSAYKGQFTTLKRDIDNISRNSDALLDDDMLETLFLHRQSLEGIERKFCDVQRTIIDDAKGDSKKTEQEEMENFLKETASVAATINRFIAKIQAASAKRAAASTVKVTQPSASGSQSSSDLSTVLNLMTNQLKEQKEQRLQDKAIMEQLVEELKRLSSGNGGNIGGSNQNETFTINPQPRRKLDVIKIRPFSGDYTEWKTFKDLFDSIIGKDEVLTASEKMQYLKTLVVGDAQPIIDSLNVCDANYTVAWDLLNREFDSTAPIVASYVKDFFSLPAVMDPTVQGIQNIQRKSNSILQALDAMSVTSRDAFIIHTILQKLDDETRVLWAGKVKKDCPTWTQFNDFLVERSFQLRMSQPENSETCLRPAKVSPQPTKKPNQRNASLAMSEARNCVYCDVSPHKLFRCKKFLALDGLRRLDVVRELKMCANCLSEQHKLEHCGYSLCDICNGKHNRLLHDSFIIANSMDARFSNAQGQGDNNERNPASCACREVSSNVSTKVFLPTVMVRVSNNLGEEILCRALLDGGSQVNIISKKLCERLHLKTRPAQVKVEGIGSSIQLSQYKADIIVRPRLKTSPYQCSMSCNVMAQVTGDQPNWDASSLKVNIPHHFQLADPTWSTSQPIDLLIGGQFYWSIMKDETHVLGPNKPILKNSVFGWVLAGSCNVDCSNFASCNVAMATPCASLFRDDQPEFPSHTFGSGLESNLSSSVQQLVSEDAYLPHFLHGELQPLTLLTKSPDFEHWVSSEETFSTKDKEIGTSYIRWNELHSPVQLPNKQHASREGFWYR